MRADKLISQKVLFRFNTKFPHLTTIKIKKEGFSNKSCK